jgi:uncharacterized DUF497 family protein
MRHSFDPAKQASNLKKHGLNLADAYKVIDSGQTEDHIRIISMRKADRHEQAIYRENLT